MTLGLYEDRARRRRQRRWVTVKWLLAVGGLGAAAVFAYESGRSLAQRDVDALSQRIAELEAGLQQAETDMSAAQASQSEAERSLSEAQQRYQQDVPTGELAELFALLRQKRAEGVTPERLGFLLEAASNDRACDDQATQKRFVLRTPLYAGGNDSVGFYEGLITVTGEGPSATDAAGKAEAWFDPSESVTLRFVELGGKETVVEGVLPLTKSIVIGAREYRFSAAVGDRGFVQVSSDSCSFP